MPNNNLYGFPQPLTQVFPPPIIAARAPTTSDYQYPLGQEWVDSVGQNAYILVNVASNVATWAEQGGVSGPVDTLTGDSGGAIGPTGGTIIVAGTANQIATIGSGHTITWSLIGPYTPATYTAHGVLMGEGTSSIVASAAGTSGQAFISGGAGADGAYGDLGVAHGGTGALTLTAHGVLLGEGTSAIVATTAGTTGQVLIGSTGADPAFGAVGVNSNLTGLVLGNTNSAFTATSFTAAGAFTPAFSLATAGDSAWTYSSRVGRYTQIGSLVFFIAELVVSGFTNTTGSGNWQLNLPVASGAFARTGHIHISGSGVDASAETANLPANFVGEIGSGASVVVLSVEEGGIGNAANALFNLTVSQVKTTGTYTVSGWYFAA